MKSVIFPAEDIRAIDRKTMFRVVMKPQPPDIVSEIKPYCTGINWLLAGYWKANGCWNSTGPLKAPYLPGETIYVKETWCSGSGIFHKYSGRPVVVYYKADNPPFPGMYDKFKWKSPIYMPEWASRFKLKILTVGAEQVQEITEEDCFREGVKNICANDPIAGATWSPLPNFIHFWDARYAKNPEYQWNKNPWMWKFGVTPPPQWRALVAENLRRENPIDRHEL